MPLLVYATRQYVAARGQPIPAVNQTAARRRGRRSSNRCLAGLFCLLLACPVLLPLTAMGQEGADASLRGPLDISRLPPASVAATDPSQFGSGGRNSLAILLRDTDSSWLGLVHSLKSIGIPLLVTLDPEQALRHDVVVVYPSLTGANTTPALLGRLRQHVEDGNSLIAFSVIGGGMKDLFGYSAYQERNDLLTLTYPPQALPDPVVLAVDDMTIRLAARDRQAGGVSYSDLENPPLARFDDGSGAIIVKHFPARASAPDSPIAVEASDAGDAPASTSAATGRTGHAYAIGFDLGHYFLRALNGRLTGVVDDYVNAYHPIVEALLEPIAAAYWQGERNPVRVLTTPYNREFTALVTHDIDFTRSLQNVDQYRKLEQSLGIEATYFIQTKYVTDYNDRAFFAADSRPILERLVSSGMAIASHSVAHSNEFRNMPLGTGHERYPDYRPFVEDFSSVSGASIAGELRVSRFLLEALGGEPVVAFRPGHLSLPRNLPEMLQATGYRYSSSITANEALTHLPYRTMFSSEYHAESPVLEFPVTIEDEQGPLLARFDQTVELANRIARHGGLVNLLIHTDEAGDKLEFERRFVEAFRQRAWFTTVPAFGDWWQARDTLQLDVEQTAPTIRRLTIRVDGAIEGLALRLPDNWQPAEPSERFTLSGNVLLVDRVVGQETVLLRTD